MYWIPAYKAFRIPMQERVSKITSHLCETGEIICKFYSGITLPAFTIIQRSSKLSLKKAEMRKRRRFIKHKLTFVFSGKSFLILPLNKTLHLLHYACPPVPTYFYGIEKNPNPKTLCIKEMEIYSKYVNTSFKAPFHKMNRL